MYVKFKPLSPVSSHLACLHTAAFQHTSVRTSLQHTYQKLVQAETEAEKKKKKLFTLDIVILDVRSAAPVTRLGF